MSSTKPKILIYDVETCPIIAHVWSLWENNVGLNQIVSDWHILSWAAKWYEAPPSEVMYMDQQGIQPIENDKKLLRGIWKLLDEADIVITQNGKHFDQKKLNARFILSGMKPPSPYRHIDTKQIASRHFGFTSNKLEYMTDKINKKYKKLQHAKFPGHALWTACLANNPKAWAEMKKYNIHDVLATEELYTHMLPWENTVHFNVYTGKDMECNCGSTSLAKNGHAYTNTGKYQRYKCSACGSNYRDKAKVARSGNTITKIT